MDGLAPFVKFGNNGPGCRGVHDLSDRQGFVFVIFAGQSMHPPRPHCRELGALWRRGR
ncbi:MAG: penicillin acylase family protein [Gammaproteobacteria bacterium]|nr:penicillin acylase family protein [Gammaproteobacteria bacterium]